MLGKGSSTRHKPEFVSREVKARHTPPLCYHHHPPTSSMTHFGIQFQVAGIADDPPHEDIVVVVVIIRDCVSVVVFEAFVGEQLLGAQSRLSQFIRIERLAWEMGQFQKISFSSSLYHIELIRARPSRPYGRLKYKAQHPKHLWMRPRIAITGCPPVHSSST